MTNTSNPSPPKNPSQKNNLSQTSNLPQTKSLSQTKNLSQPRQAKFNPARLETLNQFLQNYINKKRFSGASYLLAQGGNILANHYLGHSAFKRHGRGHPINPDTIFRIYSMTKPITAIALMMLVEEGKLKLDDRADQYIPAFSNLKVFQYGTAKQYETVPIKRPITLLDLATHQAGFAYDFVSNHPVSQLYQKHIPFAKMAKSSTLKSFVQQVAQLPLQFQPGDKWGYSIATDILGHIIETTTKSSLQEFYTKRIFQPLNMKDTSFRLTQDKIPRLAHSYYYNTLFRTNNLIDDPKKSIWLQPGFFSAGGGLLSTLPDYHSFLDMMRQGGKGLVSQKSIDFITSNQLYQNKTLDELTNVVFGEIELKGMGFGIGGTVVVDGQQTSSPAPNGTYAWGGLASTYCWLDKTNDIIFIFMTQLTPVGCHPLRPHLKNLIYKALP